MNLKAGALLLIIVVFCAEECENGECSVVQHRTETREPKYTEILTVNRAIRVEKSPC